MIDMYDPISMAKANLPNLPGLSGDYTPLLFEDTDKSMVYINPFYNNVMVFNETDLTFYVIAGLTPVIGGPYPVVIPLNGNALYGC